MSLLTFLLLEALFSQISGRTVTVTLNQHHDTEPGVASSSIALCPGDSINIICNASWAPAIEIYQGKTWGVAILSDGNIEVYKLFSFDNNSMVTYTTSFSDNAIGKTKRFVCKTTVAATPILINITASPIDGYFDRWTDVVDVEICRCSKQPQKIIKKMYSQHVTLACGPAPTTQMNRHKFQWYLDDHLLSHNNHSMEIRYVSQEDTGIYRCFAKTNMQDMVPVYTFDLKVFFRTKMSLDVAVVNVTYDTACMHVEHLGPTSYKNKVGVYHPFPENYIFAAEYAGVENASFDQNQRKLMLAPGAWISNEFAGSTFCLHNLSSATFYALVLRYYPQDKDIRDFKLVWESLSSQYLCTKPASVERNQEDDDPLKEVILANEGDDIVLLCRCNLTSLGFGELQRSPWTKINDEKVEEVSFHYVDRVSGALRIRNFSRSAHDGTYICRQDVSAPYRSSIYRVVHISDASNVTGVAQPVNIRYIDSARDQWGESIKLKWGVHRDHTTGLEKFLVKYGMAFRNDIGWSMNVKEVPVTDSGSYAASLPIDPYGHGYVVSVVAVDQQGRKSPPARAMFTHLQIRGRQWD